MLYHEVITNKSVTLYSQNETVVPNNLYYVLVGFVFNFLGNVLFSEEKQQQKRKKKSTKQFLTC